MVGIIICNQASENTKTTPIIQTSVEDESKIVLTGIKTKKNRNLPLNYKSNDYSATVSNNKASHTGTIDTNNITN